MAITEALTFDDVLLKPGASSILPADADIRTRLTREIALNIPLVSAAMDTITESRLAITMAQLGGIGIIHKNFDIERQAREVAAVKRFEAGMVVNPVTIDDDKTLGDALELMQQHGISGIPVVAVGSDRLVGILTNRDVRFAMDPAEKVAALMTREVVTAPEHISHDEARRLLHAHRIEKLVVVDDDQRCIGLITVKDMEKAQTYPNAAKDSAGRLRVGAAIGAGPEGRERAEALIVGGVDVLVVDTAHGHSEGVINAVKQVRQMTNDVQIIAGNIATGEGAKALIAAGADAVKIGIGPGSICTTRMCCFGVGTAAYGSDGRCCGLSQGGCARHCRWRDQVFGRSCQGDRRRCRLRDDRFHAGGNGRNPG